MAAPTKADKMKGLVFALFLIALYYGILFYLLSLLDLWFKKVSLFGITFLGIDIRVYFIGFIFAIFGIWLILELDDYLQFRKWRRSWK